MNTIKRVILVALVFSSLSLIGCGSSGGSSSSAVPSSAGDLTLTVNVHPENDLLLMGADHAALGRTITISGVDTPQTFKPIVKQLNTANTVYFKNLPAGRYQLSASKYNSGVESCSAEPSTVDLKDTLTNYDITYDCSAQSAAYASVNIIAKGLPAGAWAKAVIIDEADNTKAPYIYYVHSSQKIPSLVVGHKYTIRAVPMPGVNYNRAPPQTITITITRDVNNITFDYIPTKQIVAVYMQTGNVKSAADLDARATNLIGLFSDYKDTTNKPEVILAFIRPHFDFDMNIANTGVVAEGIGFGFPSGENITYADLQKFISTLQDSGISVFISVGGWVYSGNQTPPQYSFPNPTKNNGAPFPAGTTATFTNPEKLYQVDQQKQYINNWVKLASYLGADGVDLDYAETWYADATRIGAGNPQGSYLLSTAAEKFGAILTQLKLAAKQQDLRVSITAPAPSTATIVSVKSYKQWWGGNLKGLYYCTVYKCVANKRSRLNNLYQDVFKDLDHIGIMTYDLQPTFKKSKAGGIKKATTLKAQVATYVKSSQKFFNKFAPGVPVLGGIEIGQPSYPSTKNGSGYMVPFNPVSNSSKPDYMSTLDDLYAAINQGSGAINGTIIWELDKPATFDKTEPPFDKDTLPTGITPASAADVIKYFGQKHSD
jgi:hypothetical protein